MANFTINNKLILSLFIFVQFIIIITSTPGSNAELMPAETSTKTLVPIGPIYEIGFPGFPKDAAQSCSKCTCCPNPATREGCVTQQCCYSVRCNIPQKPPGYCAFSPSKCNCDSCSSA